MTEIDTTQFTNYTLEELRALQNKERKLTPITERIITQLPPEYAKRVFREQKPKTVDQIIGGLENRKGQPTQQLMDYEEARRLFWAIYKAELEKRKCKVVMNDRLRDILPNLIKWFIRDKSSSYSLNKGILMIGKTGCGKTTLFDCMKIMTRELKLITDFTRVDCVDIYEESKRNLTSIDRYKSSPFLFDDLGAEESTVLTYGNATSVMASILDRRYKKYEGSGLITHMSTNLDDPEIIERYGERIYDRMKKMFEFVFVGNSSLRK